MSAITVSEAATLLGISRRMMYSLAAPIGPVPCHRFGPAYLRRRARPQRCHLGGALNPAPPACAVAPKVLGPPPALRMPGPAAAAC